MTAGTTSPSSNVETATLLTRHIERRRYPIQPRAVFAVDAPIDIFTIYTFLVRTSRSMHANRNQTVHLSNYEVTAELINRLILMGNTQAEFMQTFRTGYRADGMRHPHSWSIVDEVECVQWIRRVIES